MKKFLTSLCLLLCTVATWGAKANGQPVTITQPDGTLLTVVLHGDEHASWYTTLDGTLLVQQSRAYYVAKVQANGTLASTGLLAHTVLQRNAQEQAAITAQDRTAFFSKMGTVRRTAISTDKNNRYFPHTGSPKALVLLVEFSDSTFTVGDPKKSFEQYLNGEGEQQNFGNRENRNYRSVKEYFKAMSNGAFTPQFDLYGPYKLQKNHAYYGENSGSNKDIHYQDLIKEACSAADNDVNFADYDQDGDGYIDLVYIIYAGYAESVTGNSADCIWPKSGSFDGGTFDGKKLYRYGLCNELNAYPGVYSPARINGTGLFIHEFSHTLGLPDLYATTSPANTMNNQGLEYWSVMDAGEYVDNGWRPAAYTAWEREVMGWLKPDTLTDTCTVADLASLDDGGKAYKVFNDNTQEHVLLQNIQQTGWSAKQKGYGLLAIRVNYSNNAVNLGDYPNNTAGKPQVCVLAADGLLQTQDNSETPSDYYAQLAGDPYPGTSAVVEARFPMTDGTTLNKPLLNISESSDGLITFDFLGKKATNAIIALTKSDEISKPIYTIDGRFAGIDCSRLSKGIYIIDGKKLVKK